MPNLKLKLGMPHFEVYWADQASISDIGDSAPPTLYLRDFLSVVLQQPMLPMINSFIILSRRF